MRFFEAAANWADRKAVDLKFARDEFDGWFAILHFSDARGTYSTTVNKIDPTGKSDVDFENSVCRLLDRACVIAHARRNLANTKTLKFAA